MRITFYVFPLLGILIASTSAQNSTSCPATLKALPSDPAYQSGTSSVIISSASDYSEYLCNAGIGYDGTGISCYAIKCQSPNYGYGGRPPGYGPPAPQYGQPALPGMPSGVGGLVAQVETAHPCWKLKQIRLNSYVYLVCFAKNYHSLLFQVAFKENNQLQLLPSETLPYSGLTSIGKAQFTAENGFVCLLAVYSSSPTKHTRDKKREPSDLLAPVYTICPNNYKWYFCGNVNIEDTTDVTVWYSQSAIHAVFIQVHQVSTCNAANAVESHYTLTPLIEYSITPNIEQYECPSKQEALISTIGRPLTEAPDQLYTLCGVRQCVVASGTNGTMLCCAVTTDHSCPIPGATPTAQPYSSFCIPYNVATNAFNVERIVFLAGSQRANDIQYVRGNGECCQFIVTTNPSGSLQAYSLATIITSLNDQTTPVTVEAAVDLGNEHMFGNAVTCSFKSKCCNSQSTCATCTRPAKYGDRYLGVLSCGNTGISNPYQTYNNPNLVVTEDGSPAYGAQPPRVPTNYSGAPVAYGPPQYPPLGPQGQYLPPGPYAIPGPYPQQQQQQPLQQPLIRY